MKNYVELLWGKLLQLLELISFLIIPICLIAFIWSSNDEFIFKILISDLIAFVVIRLLLGKWEYNPDWD